MRSDQPRSPRLSGSFPKPRAPLSPQQRCIVGVEDQDALRGGRARRSSIVTICLIRRRFRPPPGCEVSKSQALRSIDVARIREAGGDSAVDDRFDEIGQGCVGPQPAQQRPKLQQIEPVADRRKAGSSQREIDRLRSQRHDPSPVPSSKSGVSANTLMPRAAKVRIRSPLNWIRVNALFEMSAIDFMSARRGAAGGPGTGRSSRG